MALRKNTTQPRQAGAPYLAEFTFGSPQTAQHSFEDTDDDGMNGVILEEVKARKIESGEEAEHWDCCNLKTMRDTGK